MCHTPMALISTPNSSQANCAASGYGATTASDANRRASEPLMRPGSTPRPIQQGPALLLAGFTTIACYLGL